jgi:hypothetical protein
MHPTHRKPTKPKPNANRLLLRQVRDEFFNTYERMVAKLYARGQDPDDRSVPASFQIQWSHPSNIPNTNIYNMDEVGTNFNNTRKKKVAHINTQSDGLKRAMEDTDGDNNPFHVTNCLTTRADGSTVIPPYLGHSNPGVKSKTAVPIITRKYIDGICVVENGKRVNPTGIGVFVTKTGSMTKDRFPSYSALSLVRK